MIFSPSPSFDSPPPPPVSPTHPHLHIPSPLLSQGTSWCAPWSSYTPFLCCKLSRTSPSYALPVREHHASCIRFNPLTSTPLLLLFSFPHNLSAPLHSSHCSCPHPVSARLVLLLSHCFLLLPHFTPDFPLHSFPLLLLLSRPPGALIYIPPPLSPAWCTDLHPSYPPAHLPTLALIGGSCPLSYVQGCGVTST